MRLLEQSWFCAEVIPKKLAWHIKGIAINCGRRNYMHVCTAAKSQFVMMHNNYFFTSSCMSNEATNWELEIKN